MIKKTSVNTRRMIMNIMYVLSIVLFLIFIGFTRRDTADVTITTIGNMFTEVMIRDILLFLIPGIALFAGATYMSEKQ